MLIMCGEKSEKRERAKDMAYMLHLGDRDTNALNAMATQTNESDKIHLSHAAI